MICRLCGVDKEVSCFRPKKRQCKSCLVAIAVAYQRAHPERKKVYQKRYEQAHAAGIVEKRRTKSEQKSEYDRARYKEKREQILTRIAGNRIPIRAYQNHRLATNPNVKLAKRLRNRVRGAMNGGVRAGSAITDMGCTVEELRMHIESQFRPGMSWETWGNRGWHIDHIIPLASFDLTDREQFLRACHYTNLQPLWAEENHAKSKKVVAP